MVMNVTARSEILQTQFQDKQQKEVIIIILFSLVFLKRCSFNPVLFLCHFCQVENGKMGSGHVNNSGLDPFFISRS